MLTDTLDLRQLLESLLPGLIIGLTPKASGQRVVYFCNFDEKKLANIEPLQRSKWGDVVLKASQGIHANEVAYLEREIEILNSLKSPHYPRLHWYQSFVTDPRTGNRLTHRLFLTIEERIVAQPLSAVCDRYRSENKALELISQLFHALLPLWRHPQKLVHRDIKPDNILIRPDGTVAIIDLGIVREEGAGGITASASPYGPCTALYASPEQARNDKRNISFKSDLFSIGVMVYELIAGKNPFGQSTDAFYAILDRVQVFNPKSLFELKLTSKNFSSLIVKMMEKEPYRRYRTLEQLQSDLLLLKNK